MPSMVAPQIHVTIVEQPSTPKPRAAARRDQPTRRDQDSPVADLLPWADPYIAMLAARLEAQGREAQSLARGR
ncbi:MAG: hypothetical protein RIC55_19570 [Pirellulaceae bacterium]